jgi:hypothetical protein
MPRRDALKALAAAAALPLLPEGAQGAEVAARRVLPVVSADASDEAPKVLVGPRGTPSDPVLINAKVPWKKVLTPAEMLTIGALCDLIIPADEHGPAATAVQAHEYVNEWASAPDNANGLVRVRGGVAWINREAMTRFGVPFHQATDAQRTAICDEICYLPKAKPGYEAAARFFDTVRDQCSTGYYTTKEGMKAVGYIGNVPLAKFEGPPPEVLRKLGLA